MRESIECLTDVIQAAIIGENLLQDERGDRLGQFTAGLHDAQRQRNDLGGEKEIDHFGFVGLHQSADDAERREPKVFEWTRRRLHVQEWIEKERNIRLDEERARFRMRGDALEEREGIANAVRLLSRESRRGDVRVHRTRRAPVRSILAAGRRTYITS